MLKGKVSHFYPILELSLYQSVGVSSITFNLVYLSSSILGPRRLVLLVSSTLCDTIARKFDKSSILFGKLMSFKDPYGGFYFLKRGVR